MNKTDLIASVSASTGMPLEAAHRAVNATISDLHRSEKNDGQDFAPCFLLRNFLLFSFNALALIFTISPAVKLYAVLETRYQTMGNLACESGFPVHAGLPCGYTPRAIETAEQGTEYIGMDLPAVISEMSDIIPSLLDGKKRDLVRFCAVDATNYASLEKALQDVKGNLCINTEGLLMYFSGSEIHSFDSLFIAFAPRIVIST